MVEFVRFGRISSASVSNKILFFGVIASIVFSLTPLYGISYILLVIILAGRLRVSTFFNSYLSGAAIVLIILLASIMVSGIFTSLLSINNYAIINLIFAYLFCFALMYFQRNNIKSESQKIIDLSDVTALVVALVVPIVVIIIQLSSASLDQGLFKMVNGDGWDNTSHLNLLQVVNTNDNYFYSSSPITGQNGDMYNNYPQGWHLATSEVIGGFVSNAFDPSSVSLRSVLITYLISIYSWMILAIYICGKVVWGIANRSRRDRKASVGDALSFIIAMSLQIIGIFIVSLNMGYVNYIGTLPFIYLAIAVSYCMLTTTAKEVSFAQYLLLMIILTAGVSLVWVLPAPAMVLLAILVGHTAGFSIGAIIKNILLWCAIVIVGVALLAYLYILTQDVSAGHINGANAWLDYFPSTMLVLVCTLLIYIDPIDKTQNLNKAFIITSPFILYTFAIWMLAFLSGEGLGYYQAKLFGLIFSIVAIFTCVAIMNISALTARRVRGANVVIVSLAAMTIVASIFMLTNQSIDLRALQRTQYYLSPTESRIISRWMVSEDALKNSGQIIVLRDNLLTNKNHAMLFNRLSVESAQNYLASASPGASTSVESKYICIMNVYYEKNPYLPRGIAYVNSEDKLVKNLSKCIEKRSASGLKTTIILPESVKGRVGELQKGNVDFLYHREISRP